MATRGCRAPLPRLPSRVDTAREDDFEVFVDTWLAQRFLDERVYGERGHMSLVEDHRVAQRDGPFVISRLVQHVEHCAGPLSRFEEALAHLSAIQADESVT